MARETTRLSIFPLAGALLFPRMPLPLHIFEPRYRALVSDSLARDRRIAMVQPRGGGGELYEVGCIGRISDVEALEDGRFNIVLEGLTRFRILSELEVATPFRQVEASVVGWNDAELPDPLSLAARALVEQEARRFADALGYAIDWDSVSRLDDEALVNGIAQIVPFDPAAKQALLEAMTLAERAEMLAQFLTFARLADGEQRMQ
jgi:uncharacterized protein